jgi:hypothetical protein
VCRFGPRGRSDGAPRRSAEVLTAAEGRAVPSLVSGGGEFRTSEGPHQKVSWGGEVAGARGRGREGSLRCSRMALAVEERRTTATTRLWPPQRRQVRTSARNVLFKGSAHGTAAWARGARGTGAAKVGGRERPGCARHDARNALVVCTADALIALGGEFGTLSETALALKAGKPVVGLDTWELARRGQPATEIVRASSPVEAVERALALALRASSSARPGAPR